MLRFKTAAPWAAAPSPAGSTLWQRVALVNLQEQKVFICTFVLFCIIITLLFILRRQRAGLQKCLLALNIELFQALGGGEVLESKVTSAISGPWVCCSQIHFH